MSFPENIPYEYAFLLTAFLLLLVIIANLLIFTRLIRTENRIRGLLGGDSAKTIEDSLKNMQKKIKDHEKLLKDKEQHLSSLEERVSRSVQGVETLRFNPFKGHGGGGNQSFATTFIDENGDGVVISTLYSRERVGVYAKPINNFASEHTLSEEEKKVLYRSRQKLKNN